jgi:Na+/proline symporter
MRQAASRESHYIEKNQTPAIENCSTHAFNAMEVSTAQMGVPVEISLIVAFLILAAYTYTSGLRAPAMIAIVKDFMIFIVLFAAIIIIPIQLGGFGHIFAAVHQYEGFPWFFIR